MSVAMSIGLNSEKVFEDPTSSQKCYFSKNLGRAEM